MQATEADVAAHHQHLREAETRAKSAKAAAARAQVAQAQLASVSGCIPVECNGEFKRLPDVDGWPRFQNQGGQYLYYHHTAAAWAIHSVVSEEFGVAGACLETKDGTIGTGTNQWLTRCPDGYYRQRTMALTFCV